HALSRKAAGHTMAAADEIASAASGGWRRLAALVLALAAIGLPVNDFASYALMLVVAIVTFSGEVTGRTRGWVVAVAIVSIVVAGKFLLAPPRIEEGHNVFLPGGPNQVLQRELPAEVYRRLATEFDAQYPLARRCDPDAAGCWLGQGFSDRVFSFFSHGIFFQSALSRSVTKFDFSDPVWLRLGFINEVRYNWGPVSDVQRLQRDRRFWMGLRRWHLVMPWFEMVRLPAAFVGSELCWRGELMWETAG